MRGTGKNRKLARRGWTAVLAVGVATGLAAVVTPPAAAAAPPVTVVKVSLTQGGAVLVERAAGPVDGEPDGWRLNMDVRLENTGAADLTLTEVAISYSGGSNPSGQVVTTDPDASAPWVINRDPLDEDEEVTPAETILAGDRAEARVPEDRVLPFPLPDEVSVTFTFDGFDDPLTVTRDLVEYQPSGGADAFPFAASDLAAGEYISTGQNHRFGSAHRRSGSQWFAYDFSVRRWDGSAWASGEDLDGDDDVDENNEKYIWDRPVYAIADGTVAYCNRSAPDNTKIGKQFKHPDLFLDADDPDKMPGGGNSFWIQHRPGEYTLYAHFQAGSIPDEVCPDAPNPDGLKYPPGATGTQIKSGQLLGFVGNSGSSSGPHLHIHSQFGHENIDGGPNHARPMLFDNIRTLDAATFDPDGDDDPQWNDVDGAAVTISGQDVNGQQIGGFAGYGTAGRMLIDPLSRVNLEVTKTEDVDPAAAGTELNYTLTVRNHGPETATDVVLAETLPSEVDYLGDDGGCQPEILAGAFLCGLPDLPAGDEADPVTFTVGIPHDLVYDNGGPVSLVNQATVQSSGKFEATGADNATTETTFVRAEADLEITEFTVTDPLPAQLLIGEEATLGLRAVVTNHGPSWPIDARLDTVAQPGDGVVPQNSALFADALEQDELRALDRDYTVSCVEAGPREITFTAQVRPRLPADVDPHSANDTAELSVEVECVVPVAINIRPGGYPNPIHADKGTISVALLTTEAGEYDLPLDFDATTVDPASLRFGPEDLVFADAGGAPERHGEAHLEDAYELDEATLDGDQDAVLHFKAADTGLKHTDGTACLKGQFTDGADTFTFFGCDEVHPVPPGQ